MEDLDNNNRQTRFYVETQIGRNHKWQDGHKSAMIGESTKIISRGDKHNDINTKRDKRFQMAYKLNEIKIQLKSLTL